MTQPLGVISEHQYWAIRRINKHNKDKIKGLKEQKAALQEQIKTINDALEALLEEKDMLDVRGLKTAMDEYAAQHPQMDVDDDAIPAEGKTL